MKPLRLLVADDNPAILDMIVKKLKEHFTIAAACTDGEAVVRHFLALKPDIVILDISMGEVSGIDVARRLKSENCGAEVIFLTVHQDIDFVRSAIAAGASGYVYKSAVNTDLVTAIYVVSQHRSFYPDVLYSSS